MDLGNWFEDEALTVGTTTLTNFENMIEEYLFVRGEQEALDEQSKAKGVILRKMEAKLRSHFEAQGLSNYKTRAGNLILNERVMFKAPEGEGREQVLQKLRDEGEIDNVMGFNANKFSSWYKAQLDAGLIDFLPGVKEERLIYMSFRPTK